MKRKTAKILKVMNLKCFLNDFKFPNAKVMDKIRAFYHIFEQTGTRMKCSLGVGKSLVCQNMWLMISKVSLAHSFGK